jgi:hypothetical protein
MTGWVEENRPLLTTKDTKEHGGKPREEKVQGEFSPRRHGDAEKSRDAVKRVKWGVC